MFRQPSTSPTQSHFSRVPSADIPRSKFDRSHAVKTTFEAGKIIPVFLDEVLPGDTFDLTATCFTRLATPLKPVMDNIKVDLHFFFVPYRLVWDDFQKFMGERPTPDFDPNTLSVPSQRYAGLQSVPGTEKAKLVATYFGLPFESPVNNVADQEEISVLPFRAYKLIWNEWYRDQNLQFPQTVPTSSTTENDTILFTCLPRNKRRDYFTSALPWPQKGDPVTIPLGGSIPITGNAFLADGSVHFIDSAGGISTPMLDVTYKRTSMLLPGQLYGSDENDEHEINGSVSTAVTTNLTGNLASATSVTINELRTAFQIQKLLERDARGGTRYIEIILSHFGVHSDDARLQRPEFLGGGTYNVNFNPIAATMTNAAQPQGNLAAFATGVGNGSFKKSFTEHGMILGFASARADLTYQRGIERMWSRKTRYDFYWPALAHLGEQAILNKEINYGINSTAAQNNGVFGYQERYAEYRYKPSRITGVFNSDYGASLDVWHLAQDFESLPLLNDTFIRENPPLGRISAVPSEPPFLADIWFDLKCDRPMPIYSVPGLIDHF